MPLRRKAAVPASASSAMDTSSHATDLSDDAESYTAPRTRSAAVRSQDTQPAVKAAQDSSYSSSSSPSSDNSIPGQRKARTRSRSPATANKLARQGMTPHITEPAAASAVSPRRATKNGQASGSGGSPEKPRQTHKDVPPQTDGTFLAAPPSGGGGWSWRELSRSRSPLGLIPIHRHFRTFVHRHEVPRKALHVSIGFFVAWLYTTGTQTTAVAPYLMGALVPIAATDVLRHRSTRVNRLYVGVLGALMRESEYAGYNGVIWYLAGAWAVLRLLPKDVGVMSVLLLSWCDTAASTFGRLWGRHTPRLRRGKSLAGSTAAFAAGVATSYFFYGWLVPTYGPMPGDEEGFLFRGALALPARVAGVLGGGGADGEGWSVTGSVALGVVSVVSGLVASASEMVDFFGWDDNVAIPVLSGLGLYGFLKLFG